MSDIIYEEFLPKVFIYKNLLPNAKEMAEYADWFMESGEEHLIWRKPTEWGVFGENIAFDRSWVPETTALEKFPEPTREPQQILNMNIAGTKEEEYFEKESQYLKDLVSAFEKSTRHYLNAQNIEIEEDWWMMYPAICRYNPTIEENYRGEGNVGPLAMVHHTDYEKIKADMPGDKFLVTCTMYLNDDFEGGEVEFLVDGKPYLYTPEAGDVVIFPSGHPDFLSEDYTYYHGVGAIKSGKKYFVRSFWMKPYEGSPEWLANRDKYGEEVWMKMEEARMVAGLRTHEALMYQIEISEEPLTFEDAGIDTSKECGLHEFDS